MFKTRTRAAWLEQLSAAGVPATPVNTLDEAFDDPQTEARGTKQTLSHPRLGDLPSIGSPLRLSRTPAQIGAPPPLLGEHGDALLRALGLNDEEIDELRLGGVIGPEFS